MSFGLSSNSSRRSQHTDVGGASLAQHPGAGLHRSPGGAHIINQQHAQPVDANVAAEGERLPDVGVAPRRGQAGL